MFIAFGGKESSNAAVNKKMVDLVRQVEANFHAAGYDASNFRVVVTLPNTPKRHGSNACRVRSILPHGSPGTPAK